MFNAIDTGMFKGFNPSPTKQPKPKGKTMNNQQTFLKLKAQYQKWKTQTFVGMGGKIEGIEKKLAALPRGKGHPLLCDCKLCQKMRSDQGKNKIWSMRLPENVRNYLNANREEVKLTLIQMAAEGSL